MIEVIIKDKSANEIMEMVRELREQGLIQGIDFDFNYKPAAWGEEISFVPLQGRYTVFTFYTEKYATFFTLKYSA